MALRKLWLLFRKNLILRKRQYIVTAFEIVLPTLFAILMAYMRAALGSTAERVDDKFNPPTSEKELFRSMVLSMGSFRFVDPDGFTTIAYTPNEPEVERFVKEMGAEIEQIDRAADFPMNLSLKWEGFENEREIEVLVAEQGLSFEPTSTRLYGAIAVYGLRDQGDYPPRHKISYKIRLVDAFYDTRDILPWVILGGIDCESQLDDYRFTGFSGLQIVAEKILAKNLFGPGSPEPPYNISTEIFPCPAHDGFDINQLYFIFLPQFMVLGFIFIVPSLVRGIVSEKETGIKELMKMSGIHNWMHWMGWMLNSIVVLIISVTIVIILFFVPFNSETGPVLKNSDPSLWWFVLLLYCIWGTTYCFLISSVFNRPTLATTVGIVIWLVSYYGISVPLEQVYENLSLGVKMLLCLAPNMGVHYALKVLSSFEAKAGVGAQWKHFGKSISSMDSLALWHVVFMMILSSVLYTIMAMYLENIVPSKYGVRKPFYYIFLPSTWGFSKNAVASNDIPALRSSVQNAESEKSFEKEPDNLRPGLEVLKLRKEFDGKAAVSDVSFKAYEGQIFTLLGHNGAGKSTTISMLTGLLGPSGGTALVNNKDIRNEMNDIRETTGLCPQHNLLFSKLTVSEHLKFFGMVRGLTNKEAEQQVPDLIRKLQLEEKKNTLSMSLSGGQKRRLSLGCAIIGKAKILFIDECSSGLDPEVRRVIWDLLLSLRASRTIILTTHFLEEADVLGDRVAIMASGKIKCCGTPLFLKKYYGTGYTMTVGMNLNTNPEHLLSITRNHIPSAYVKSKVQRDEVTEIQIALSTERDSTALFPGLFSDLLNHKATLGIQEVGIGLTTMDEVFLKVDELEHTVNNNSGNNNGENHEPLACSAKVVGPSLVVSQFWALLLKKILYSFRRWKLLASQLILPWVLLIAAVLLTNINYESDDPTPALRISLSAYKDPITVYGLKDSSSIVQEIGNAFSKVVGPSALSVPAGSNVSLELLEAGRRDEDSYFQRHIVAASLDTEDLIAMFSSIAHHSSPLAVNILSNTMLDHIAPGKDYMIEVTNHPLSSQASKLFEAAGENPVFSDVAPFVVGILVSIGLALLAASYIVMPIEERKCSAKQLQLMTGVNPVIFWGAGFIWDYFLTLFCVSVMIGFLFIFERYEGFTNNGGAGAAFTILAIYGIGGVLFSHLMSLVSSSPAGGFALVTVIHIITGTCCAMGTYILETADLTSASNIVGWIGRVSSPTYGAAKSLMLYSEASTRNSRCTALDSDIKSILCKPYDFYDITEFQSCCDNCQDLGAKCFEPEDYLVWKRPNGLSGITQELLCMIVMSCVYFFILMVVEYGLVKRVLNTVWKQKALQFVPSVVDDDVQQESHRIKTLSSNRTYSQDAIVVDSLCKSYGTFSAVSQLSFGVHHAECFGLLGINGAGKTTTFKMLTGAEIISHGNAWIGSHALQSDRKSFLQKLGYCPQFDGIIGVLTGEEMLGMFARLRGLKGSDVTNETQKWLDRFGLLSSGKVQCQNYSGGMKRRLSAAMALIGDPPILLLDEPTTGVDPVSRRQFWSIIGSLRNAGRSIILTSHSMEECENLCSRLGIMVNGELQCLGRVQHLKQKYAQGYTLTVRTKPTPLGPQNDALLNGLIQQITTKFHPCVMKDHHQNVMEFHIQSSALQLDKIFSIMENIKAYFSLSIDDYSIQQTTLEEVFLSFARRQYNTDRTVQTSKFRKLMSCMFGV